VPITKLHTSSLFFFLSSLFREREREESGKSGSERRCVSVVSKRERLDLGSIKDMKVRVLCLQVLCYKQHLLSEVSLLFFSFFFFLFCVLRFEHN
jgi:hypothetical protein